MRVQRIERLQRIIVIQGVSLVRILNHPSLDRLVGRDSKYPLTQSVGRENLSGCHLAPRGLRPLGARWHPSRFSLPLSFVCGYSRISPFLTLSFGEDLWILTRSPPSITLIIGCTWGTLACLVDFVKMTIVLGIYRLYPGYPGKWYWLWENNHITPFIICTK